MKFKTTLFYCTYREAWADRTPLGKILMLPLWLAMPGVLIIDLLCYIAEETKKLR